MGKNFPFDELSQTWRFKEPERVKERQGIKAVDDNIFYCPECLQCWEHLPYVTGRGRKNKIIHYDDFPSINKPRKVCYKCEEKI
tara:strand:- start:1185 stop:1436 length:252 start_codon:yes stop_codon:yes gene_type:complete